MVGQPDKLFEMDLRWLGLADVADVQGASALFDDRVREVWALRFLEQNNHHLCVAYSGGEPAGFVTGVEMTHPDKGTEMFLYELGVDEAHRGKGIGKALVRALLDRARERDCYGVWVLTARDNASALATYRGADPDEESDEALLGWRFSDRVQGAR